MRLIASTVLLLVLGAAPAAASWSAPRAYDPAPAGCDGKARFIPIECVGEPAPRVAVNPSGAAVAAWVDLRGRVRAATADRAGRFTAAVTLTKSGLRPTAALAPDGTATVVWRDASGTLRFARRTAGRSFGAATRLAPRGSKAGDDFAKAAGAPDGSVAVLYESPFRSPQGQYVERLRAVELSAGGRPGAVTELGRGGLGRDSSSAAADGTLVGCCLAPPASTPDAPPASGARLVVFRPGVGWSFVSATAVAADAIETVFGTGSALALGTTKVEQGGDAGVLGVPGLARTGEDGALGPALHAPVTRKDRGLAPGVTIDGSGRSVLLYQEKARSQAFSRDAPVYATVAAAGARTLGARQRLDAGADYEPTVRPLGSGAIGVWQAERERWEVAIEVNGRFRRVAAPRGLGPSRLGEDFSYAYDLETNGTHAVLAWSAGDGSVRVSELGG